MSNTSVPLVPKSVSFEIEVNIGQTNQQNLNCFYTETSSSILSIDLLVVCQGTGPEMATLLGVSNATLRIQQLSIAIVSGVATRSSLLTASRRTNSHVGGNTPLAVQQASTVVLCGTVPEQQRPSGHGWSPFRSEGRVDGPRAPQCSVQLSARSDVSRAFRCKRAHHHRLRC